MKRNGISLATIIFVLFLLTACGSSSGVEDRKEEVSPSTGFPIPVTVSIQPQKYFVERIGDGWVDVNVMVPPGSDPHTFEPKPHQIRALSRAVLYFSIGVEFEHAWMDKFVATNPNMRVVDTSQGIRKLPMLYEEHGHEGETEGGTDETDPHIWLSPRLVKVQAETIYNALREVDAARQAEYRAALESFLADIDRLDKDIRATLTNLKTDKFIVFHPAWGYFAEDYGLEQVPIEVGGSEPSATELANLITFAKEHNIKIIFASPEFNTKSAQVIAEEIQGEVLLISPLEEDWLANMRTIADALARALKE